jgi:hypothetical protein
MSSEDGPSASVLIERERRFQDLTSRARSLDLRISVMTGTGSHDGVALYRPIDLISGQPVLGPDPAANVLRSLDELEIFLDAQFAVD